MAASGAVWLLRLVVRRWRPLPVTAAVLVAFNLLPMVVLLLVLRLVVMLLLLVVVAVLLLVVIVLRLVLLLVMVLGSGRAGSLILHHGLQVAVVFRVAAATELLRLLLLLVMMMRGWGLVGSTAAPTPACAAASRLAMVLLPRRARLALVPLGERHGLHVRAEHLLVVAVVDKLDHARVPVGGHLVHHGPVELAVFPILGQHLLSREKPLGTRGL